MNIRDPESIVKVTNVLKWWYSLEADVEHQTCCTHTVSVEVLSYDSLFLHFVSNGHTIFMFTAKDLFGLKPVAC